MDKATQLFGQLPQLVGDTLLNIIKVTVADGRGGEVRRESTMQVGGRAVPAVSKDVACKAAG